MKFLIADPALRTQNVGHHPAFCRSLLHGLRARGIQARVLANVQVDAALRNELGAEPFFRAHTYWNTDGDPVCGWLNAFDKSVQATVEDLRRLADLREEDLIYFNSAQAAQVLAAARWTESLPVGARPRIVLEFGIEPGMKLRRGAEGAAYEVPDPRVHAGPTLLRFVGGKLKVARVANLHFMTFHRICSEAYGLLLERPVGVLPFPCREACAPRVRAPARPIRIAALGHQRPDKGYHLLPQIVARILEAHHDVHMLVQNSNPGLLPQVDVELAKLAERNPRLTVQLQAATAAQWNEILDASDLILCPYESERYTFSHSGLVAEALAKAIPLVVPARTTLSSIVEEFHGGAVTFDVFQPDSIMQAVAQAVQRFDEIARRAQAAAARWNDEHGVERLIDAVLALAPAAG